MTIGKLDIDEKRKLGAGVLRDTDDEYVCGFTCGSIFRSEDDSANIGWLDLDQNTGTEDLMEMYTGPYRIVIEDLLLEIVINDILAIDGDITASFKFPGSVVDLSKYDVEFKEEEEEPISREDVFWEFSIGEDSEVHRIKTIKVVAADGEEDEIFIYLDADEHEDFVRNNLSAGACLSSILGNQRCELLIRGITLGKDSIPIKLQILDTEEEKEEKDYLDYDSIKPLQAEKLVSMGGRYLGSFNSGHVMRYTDVPGVGGNLFLQSKEEIIPAGVYQLFSGDTIMYIDAQESVRTDHGLMLIFEVIDDNLEEEEKEEGITITYENIPIEIGAEIEPCYIVGPDGSETWFLTPEELGKTLDYCDYHTKELLDDESKVNMQYMGAGRCTILRDLIQELADGDYDEGCICTRTMKVEGGDQD